MVVNLFQDLSCMELIDFLFWSGLGMGRLPLLQITLPYWRQSLSLHRPGKQIIPFRQACMEIRKCGTTTTVHSRFVYFKLRTRESTRDVLSSRLVKLKMPSDFDTSIDNARGNLEGRSQYLSSLELSSECISTHGTPSMASRSTCSIAPVRESGRTNSNVPIAIQARRLSPSLPLDLETTRPSATTSALELPALALHIWLLQWVLVQFCRASMQVANAPCGSGGRSRSA